MADSLIDLTNTNATAILFASIYPMFTINDIVVPFFGGQRMKVIEIIDATHVGCHWLDDLGRDTLKAYHVRDLYRISQ
jgi:hypothetical protein